MTGIDGMECLRKLRQASLFNTHILQCKIRKAMDGCIVIILGKIEPLEMLFSQFF